jgi:predicted hydrocarbon binding protein
VEDELTSRLHGLVTKLRSREQEEEPQGCRVRGLDLLGALDFVRKRGGRDQMTRVLERLGEEDLAVLQGGRRELKGRRWYPFQTHCRLLRAIDAELGEGDLTLLYDVGQHIARRDVPRLFRPILRAGNPGWVISKSTQLWRLFHSSGRWTIDRGRTELLARLDDRSETDEAFCEAFMGWVCATLEMSGGVDISIDHPVCAARGAPACVFVGRWGVADSL